MTASLYFAYDLNLDRRRMVACCPTAKSRFSASLPNFQLIFAGWSREWRGGIATIKRAGREKVLGGVYEVNESDMIKLDRQQGFPAASDKIKVTLFRDTGEAIEAFTYLPKHPDRPEKPSSDYLKIIQKAYIDWGLL
ncbi:MAG: gamma-glutamylcyclotransferase family protein [Dehalococcoidales bacterium]|jgi:hypothetical protein|nr:gamma-glutamylcyclotransferase [Dehalococcoidales bacterium]MDD3264411.1 gamma-glutamylcyclotransferase [Dehalococcoidales bacterium]MDD4321952.1 gamma-glutamylcyclotransferase [Dehalococcoidales bacterium]MDD4794037.1 gamma-glutamylcyclotransferase [Dehalococcoidales bacterium]MDD5122751.1 gamma-glutamylcyclotransferase [Dehalococcoidales bacterium]